VGNVSCQSSSQTIRDKVSIGSLSLENGDYLLNAEIAYERVGNINGEAIIVCHALTGNQDAAGTSDHPGWWKGFIGPGLYIDTNEYQVITMNVLGGCCGSTGPNSINPTTGDKYRGDFPAVTIRDMVHSQYKALERLGIKKAKAIIGGSLGGMQVLEWGIIYPQFAEILIPIAVTPYFTDYAIAFNSIGRQAIMSDPAWNNGNYQEGVPIKGLEIARMVGIVTYRSDKLFNDRFKREKKNDKEIEYQVDSYMKYQGEKFTKRFDANSYLCLLQAMDQFDIGSNRGGWEKALIQIEAKVCLISFSGDLLYPSSMLKQAADLLVKQKKEAEFVEVNTHFGHDGFLVEFEKWGQTIKRLLAKKEVNRCPA
jgi:homoserine O-acetyltransferase